MKTNNKHNFKGNAIKISNQEQMNYIKWPLLSIIVLEVQKVQKNKIVGLDILKRREKIFSFSMYNCVPGKLGRYY